jgi:hypothetical protein
MHTIEKTRLQEIYLGVWYKIKHAAGVFDRSLTAADRAATYCVDHIIRRSMHRIICRSMHRIICRYTYASDVSDLLRASNTDDMACTRAS